GNSWSRVSVALAPTRGAGIKQRMVLTAHGLARVAVGAGHYSVGVVLASMRRRAGGARTLMRGLGMLTGAWGHTYDEYGRAEEPDNSARRASSGARNATSATR